MFISIVKTYPEFTHSLAASVLSLRAEPIAVKRTTSRCVYKSGDLTYLLDLTWALL